jgi:hypothetical protein
LDGQGAILDLARELSRLMSEAGVSGAVIGGIAVVLHGHVRTTKDIDLFVPGPPEPLGELLLAHGFAFDAARREFRRDEIPVHLVTRQQVEQAPRRIIEIEGVKTVSLEDLVEMKLRSGTANLLRAQDLADAIGLIRRHSLTGEFARSLDKSLRPTFRRLVKELKRERGV